MHVSLSVLAVISIGLLFATSVATPAVSPYIPAPFYDCSGAPIQCTVQCARTQGYMGTHRLTDRSPDAAWATLAALAPNAGFCGWTFAQMLDSNTAQLMLVPFRNVGQQYVGMVLNYLAFTCHRVNNVTDARMYEMYKALSNGTLCTAVTMTPAITELVTFGTAFNEGFTTGVPACDEGRLSTSMTMSVSCTPTPSQTPTGTATASPTPTPTPTPSISDSATPSASESNTPSVSESNTPSTSASQTPSVTVHPSYSSTPSVSASASRSASASQTPSALPSESSTPTPTASHTVGVSASVTRTPAPSTVCTVPCTRTQGFWGARLDHPAWQLLPSSAVLCGQPYAFWLRPSSENGYAPERWLALARQFVAATLNLLNAGCTHPMPLEVAEAYEEARRILTDSTLCAYNHPSLSRLIKILDDYNNGLYARSGGPPHCDSLKLRSVDDDDDETATVPASTTQCCVRPIGEWLANNGDTAPFIDDLVLCNRPLGVLLSTATVDPVSAALAEGYLNTRSCGQVAPQEPNEAWRRLQVELASVACIMSLATNPLKQHLVLLADTVSAWSNGSYAGVGGPCACSDVFCDRMLQAMQPQGGADYEAIVENDDSVTSLRHMLALAKHPAFITSASVGMFCIGAACVGMIIGSVFLVHHFKQRRHVRQGSSRLYDDSDDPSDVSLPFDSLARNGGLKNVGDVHDD